jgi:hypothetical protein
MRYAWQALLAVSLALAPTGPAFAQSAAGQTGQGTVAGQAGTTFPGPLDAVGSMPCHLMGAQAGQQPSDEQLTQFAQEHTITLDQARQMVEQCRQTQGQPRAGSTGQSGMAGAGTAAGGTMGQGGQGSVRPGSPGQSGVMPQGTMPNSGLTAQMPGEAGGAANSMPCAMMAQAAPQMTEDQVEQMAKQHGMSKDQFRDMLQRCRPAAPPQKAQ